jgi:hypothetical protein
MKILIDNIDIYTVYGVDLALERGLLDPPKAKTGISFNWKDEHGLDEDLTEIYFEAHPFTLDFRIKQTTKSLFYSNLIAFYNLILSPGLHAIKFPDIARTYYAKFLGGENMERLTSWNDALMFGTLTMQAIETNPVNLQYLTTNPITTPSITITCTKVLLILWGDGLSDYVVGTAQTKTHDYNQKNLLGTAAYCDSLTPWGSPGDPSPITNDGVSSNKCIQIMYDDWDFCKILLSSLCTNGYKYFVSGYSRITSGSSNCDLKFQDTHIYGVSSGTWTRFGGGVVYNSALSDKYITLKLAAGTGRFDNICIRQITDLEYILLSDAELLTKYPFDGDISAQKTVAICGDLNSISSLSVTNLTRIP